MLISQCQELYVWQHHLLEHQLVYLVAVQCMKVSHPLLGNSKAVSLGCNNILTLTKVLAIKSSYQHV